MIRSTQSHDWFYRFSGNDDCVARLFCFPHAGGDTLAYAPLAEILVPELEVLSLQLPARWPRFNDQACESLSTLINALYSSFCWFDKPFAFFGHSMGGIIAYELARELYRQHEVLPEHIFVSACRAPHLPSRHPELHSLSNEKLVDTLVEMQGLTQEMRGETELLELLLPRLRTDAKMVETYVSRSEAPLECALTAVGGDIDSWVSREELDAWSAYTQNTFETHIFPGGHFYFREDWRVLANVIGSALSSVDQR